MTIDSMKLAIVALAVGAFPTISAQVPAKGDAVLRGVVLADSTETPLAGAQVSIPSAGLATTSAADGAFRLGGISPGTYVVQVRVLGYAPLAERVRFAAGDSVERDYLLLRAAVPIAGVAVKGAPDATHNAKMSTFEARMRAGTGHFITRATLDSLANRRLGEIMMSRLAPARVIAVGSSAWVATRRGQQSVTAKPGMSRFDRLRGADPTACYASVYLDGTLVYGGNAEEPLFDVNTLETREVAGIEYYAGGSELPPEINRTARTCGALVIWTR